jgi:copper chaperone CopZ
MTCGGCTSNVTHALEAISGVKEVEVSLSRAEATVRYDELLTSPERLKSAVTGAGYGVEGSNPTDERSSKGAAAPEREPIARKPEGSAMKMETGVGAAPAIPDHAHAAAGTQPGMSAS